MGTDDYGPAVKTDRRARERRAMPPQVRAVYVDLQRYARAIGATADGIQWVAVPKPLLQAATECIQSSWRAQSDSEQDGQVDGREPGRSETE